MGKENVDYTQKHVFVVSIVCSGLTVCTLKTCQGEIKVGRCCLSAPFGSTHCPTPGPILISYTYLLAPYTRLTLGSIKGTENVILKT